MGIARGAHDRDRRGAEDRAQGGDGGRPVLLVAGGQERLGGGGPERGEHHRPFVAEGGLQAGVAQHPDHPAVLAQHLPLEAGDAQVGGRIDERAQQRRAHPASLLGVFDQDGELRGVGLRVPAVEAGHAHDPPAGLGDQGEAGEVVDVGEEAHALGVHRAGREEAQPDALG